MLVNVFNIYRTSPEDGEEDGDTAPSAKAPEPRGFENECLVKVEFRKTVQQISYCKNPMKLELKRMVLMGHAPSEEPKSNTCTFGLGTDLGKDDSILIEFFRIDVNFFRRKK